MERNYIVIKTKQKLSKISFEEIVFFEKDLRKIIVHTYDNKLAFYGKFEDIADILDNRFYKCHRSYIINLANIKLMEAEKIYFVNKESITISRVLYCHAKDAFLKYLGM